MNKIPKSFVMRSGIVGTSVTALVRDVRRVLEPNTASHLRVNIMDFLCIEPRFLIQSIGT
jgi:ribosome biogenesis protein SSF1/2